MQLIIDSIKLSLDTKNWYSAMVMSLSLIDVCGGIDNSTKATRITFENWFNKYLAHHYKREVGAEHELIQFLAASDCYAFRCVLLHEGSFKVDGKQHSAKVKIDKYLITYPESGLTIHNNLFNNENSKTLQIQVDIFANNVIDAYDKWRNDPNTQQKLVHLNDLDKLEIVSASSIFSRC
jgi:hypothetical protein